MQLVVIAGGKGTRLRERLGDLPKPMVDVDGRPLLERQILLAKQYGITDIVLLLGHGANKIREYFEDGSNWGVKIRYHEESEPLGTAGAVLDALPSLGDRFLVMYGDTMLNIDLERFAQAHSNSGAPISLLLHPNDHPQDSDLVELDDEDRVLTFHNYPHDPNRYYANLVNAALYIVDRKSMELYAGVRAYPDFAKHLFPHLIAQGVRLHGYRSPEYIKDAGTPERLDKVTVDLRSGRIARSSFATPSPAVFLDRDGTINREVSYVRSPDQLELLDGVAAGIRRLNSSGVRVIVITNQPVIARGECSERNLKEIHNKLETELGAQGAYVDGIYYCPHHPDKGFQGERADLKMKCSCRKPATGLIDRATSDFNLDRSRSWLIGDSNRDVQTAFNAGIRSILVRTGFGGSDGKYGATPNMVCADLPAAVEFLLSSNELFGQNATFTTKSKVEQVLSQ